jgi:hypothetical protein
MRSQWSDLAVLATLSLSKNEPRSISFRSLPNDGGLVVIKTRPSRGFRWCATVLRGCLVWWEHHGQTERHRLV